MDRIDEPSNHQFTYTYSQPDEYRFCQDSVIFPQFIAKRIKANVTSDSRILDICAGCGVIGFELAHYLRDIKRMDFLEIQPVFRAHFEKNVEITSNNLENFRFLEMNYAGLLQPAYKDAYDFIVGNPPYFFRSEGKPSPSQIKNRCRFFLDATFEELIRALVHALKPRGSAYLLVKSGRIHGRDSLAEVPKWIEGTAALTLVAEIRGTAVIEITKCI